MDINITNRDWILVVLDSIDEMILKLRKIAYTLTSEELKDFHHNFYDQLGVNIYKNFQFMELVITRRLQSIDGECNPIMNDEDLARYLREHWEQMVSDIFKH